MPAENDRAITTSGCFEVRAFGKALMNLKFGQFRNRLDMMGLREHIKHGERVKRITTCNYLAKIARERRRIARDIADLLWTKLQDSANDARFCAHARRIEQKKINLGCARFDSALDR